MFFFKLVPPFPKIWIHCQNTYSSMYFSSGVQPASQWFELSNLHIKKLYSGISSVNLFRIVIAASLVRCFVNTVPHAITKYIQQPFFVVRQQAGWLDCSYCKTSCACAVREAPPRFLAKTCNHYCQLPLETRFWPRLRYCLYTWYGSYFFST